VSNDDRIADWPISEPQLPSPLTQAREYQANVDAGMSVEDVARQAQRTVAHVKHMLKLLELAPEYEGK
jgi:hypothetical protein